MRIPPDAHQSLPPGILEAIHYEIEVQTEGERFWCRLCPSAWSRFGPGTTVDTLDAWIATIVPEHQPRYREQLTRSFDSDCLVSAYRKRFGMLGAYWVFDHAHCEGDGVRRIAGRLWVARDIDVIARIMKSMIFR